MTTLPIKTDFDATVIAEKLNILLASTEHFYIIYKNYHWNLIDPQFYSLHLLYDKHSGEIHETVDAIAERIKKIGGNVDSRLETFVERSCLDAQMVESNQASLIMSDLETRHNVYIKLLEEIIKLASDQKDYATADELTQYLETQGEQRWFIMAHNNLKPTA